MTPESKQKIDELSAQHKAELGALELEVLSRPFTLADAVREGSTVTSQAYGWGDGNNACAMHAAVLSAKAHGLM